MIARVGLTGGIGSGKSVVASMFAALGVPLLDLDDAGRQLLHSEPSIIDKLVAGFGSSVRLPSGELDRGRLAELAFASQAATRRLNAIMHPLIRQEEDRWVSRQNGPYCLVEASVLIESGGANRMDAVVAVLADLAVRQQRVLQRGSPAIALFGSIVKRQCDDDERLAVSDYVIVNNGSLAELEAEVLSVHQRLLERFRPV